MKLTRLTTAIFKQEMNKRRARGQSADPPIADKDDRREAIEAILLDLEDIMVLIGATQGDIASISAKLRNDLRKAGSAE